RRQPAPAEMDVFDTQIRPEDDPVPVDDGTIVSWPDTHGRVPAPACAREKGTNQVELGAGSEPEPTSARCMATAVTGRNSPAIQTRTGDGDAPIAGKTGR